jgi:hypothetical protein
VIPFLSLASPSRLLVLALAGVVLCMGAWGGTLKMRLASVRSDLVTAQTDLKLERTKAADLAERLRQAQRNVAALKEYHDRAVQITKWVEKKQEEAKTVVQPPKETRYEKNFPVALNGIFDDFASGLCGKPAPSGDGGADAENRVPPPAASVPGPAY